MANGFNIGNIEQKSNRKSMLRLFFPRKRSSNNYDTYAFSGLRNNSSAGGKQKNPEPFPMSVLLLKIMKRNQ
jgi:hypothetical protein